jgi:protein-histidine pros-kinase
MSDYGGPPARQERKKTQAIDVRPLAVQLNSALLIHIHVAAVIATGRIAVGARLKVNLILLAVTAIVIELFAVVATPFLENVARTEVLQKARIMMEAAAGIRIYTSNEIAPLLSAKRDDDKFHPQTVPSYAASKNFALLARKFTDYAYREAALNPTNPSNRAVDWEADIIYDFRQNRHKRELITEREIDNGRVLTLSQPIVSGGPCLSCHGAADQAPRSMIATYGTQNGFGWGLDEVVGAQIVAVPMAVALEHSTRIRNLFIAVLGGIFLLLIGLFNVLPILMTTLPGSYPQPGEMAHPRAAQPVKAFGYGLLVAGMVVVIIVYVAVYAREGTGGLEQALNPFVLVNYASIAAVVPGMLTIWLARYFAHARSGALRPADQSKLRSKEISPWQDRG